MAPVFAIRETGSSAMDRTTAIHLLQVMIDYFEAGNQHTDTVAKSIIESDFEYLENWQAEIRRCKAEAEWTGLRAPEAEILASALSTVQKLLKDSSF